MNLKIELSETQREIVYADNIAIYVKASAGSGKTRVLTERVRYLLGNTNKKVLALTFTNKAGEEIKERLKDIEDIEKRTYIGTFHGFCQSILENHGKLIGYDVLPNIFEDDSDRLELIEQAIQENPSFSISYKKQDNKQKKDFRYRVLNYISSVKRELIFEGEKFNEDENVVLLYQTYQEILHSQNAIDFDDLLLIAYKLFTDYPKISQLYRRSFYSICIDEAQDLNNAQYQLLLALTNNEFKNVMLVGDPNQSIYHFNGSSPDYMEVDFVKDFSPVIIELNENYRSSRKVLKAAQKIIPDAEYIKGTVKEGIFEIYEAANEEDEARWIFEKINELIKLQSHSDIENEITYEKIAILARNKYVFSSIENMLLNNSIPYYYKMTPGAIKYESKIMKIFDLALRVHLNPKDKLHLLRLKNMLNIQSIITNDNVLEKIINNIDDPYLKNILLLVADLNDDGSNIKQLFEEFKSSLILKDTNEKVMVFNDIDELLKHWHNYAKKTDSKSLIQFKNAMALGITHPLTQHSGVTLSTVHTMKGQEFDIVFIIGMDDETFPDYRAIRKGGIDLKQEMNNCYVAFTRSKRFLYVTWPNSRMMPWGDTKNRSISRFLLPFIRN